MRLQNLKLLIISTTVLTLAACAGKNSTALSHYEKDPKTNVILDSRCDDSCKEIIRMTFPDEARRYYISRATVLAVNEEFGPVKYYDKRGSYNSFWSGHFSIKTNSGTKKLVVKPNYWKAHPMMQGSLSFSAAPHNEYFVGDLRITAKGGKNHSYAWSPVVVNKTKKIVVYPNEELQWRGENIQGASPIFVPIPIK